MFGEAMSEEALISHWNELRKTIIRAQMVSVVMLAVVLVLVVIGSFNDATIAVKVFAIVVLATTGILSLINQFAVLREGSAIVQDLTVMQSATAKTIAASEKFMKTTQLAMGVSAAAIFILFIWAIF
jgi:hypothetical protein